MNSIEIRNVTKSYKGVTVLDNISFSFAFGKIYGLLGRNGAGKKGRQFLYHGGQRCLCFNGQLQSPADNRLIITKAE